MKEKNEHVHCCYGIGKPDEGPEESTSVIVGCPVNKKQVMKAQIQESVEDGGTAQSAGQDPVQADRAGI